MTERIQPTPTGEGSGRGVEAMAAAINGISDYGWCWDGALTFTVSVASRADAVRLDTLLKAATEAALPAEVPTPPASRGTGVPTWEEIEAQVHEYGRVCADFTEGASLTAPIIAEADLLDMFRTLSAAAEQAGAAKREVAELRGVLERVATAAGCPDPICLIAKAQGEESAADVLVRVVGELRAAAEQGARDREDAALLSLCEDAVIALECTGQGGEQEWRAMVGYTLKSGPTPEYVYGWTPRDVLRRIAARPPHQGRA